MNKLKIGVIGAGVLGTFHIHKCVKNPDVECVGFHDVSLDRRVHVAEKTGVKSYDTVQNLIADVDAVIIATPSSTHVEMAEQCLLANRHVLIEKPLAPSYEEGKHLVDLAHKNGCVIHVGHSEAFNAAFVKLLSYNLHPKFIEIHRLAQFSIRGTDVPVVLDLMVHDLQLLLRLCKEEPVYKDIVATGVAVVSDDIDIANARIPFPSGCVVNLTASRISAKRMRKIRLFEKDNYFSVDLDKEEIEHCELKRDADGKPDFSVALPGLPIAMDSETLLHVDALESELDAFVTAIQTGKQLNGVKGDEALVVLKITDTIMALISKNPVQ